MIRGLVNLMATQAAVLNWLDMSNFSGNITVAQALAWKQQGVVGVTIGCQDTTIAIQQGQACQTAGLIVDLYAFLYWGFSVAQQVAKALTAGHALGLTPEVILWLDCEATPPNEAAGQTPNSRLSQLGQAVQQAVQGGFRAGIYTGKDYWQDQMGNSTAFCGLPLFFAAYWDDHRLVDTVSFGGWTAVARHQFEGTIVLNDVSVDGDDDINLVCAHSEEADMTPAEQQAFATLQLQVAQLTAIVVGNGYGTDPKTRLTGDAAFQQAVKDGGSLYLGLGLTQADVAKLKTEQASGLPDHTHTPGGVAKP